MIEGRRIRFLLLLKMLLRYMMITFTSPGATWRLIFWKGVESGGSALVYHPVFQS